MNYLLYDFTCASMASFLTLFAAHPFDTIKSNMQNDNKKYNSLLKSFYLTYKEFGILGYYRGFSSNFFLIMTQNALLLTSYEALQRKLDRISGYHNLNVFVAGCLSGVPLLITLVPLEQIKVLQQCNEAKTNKLLFFSDSSTVLRSKKSKVAKKLINNNVNNYANKSMHDTIKDILRHKGILGLYRGFWITLNRDFLANGFYFLTYNILKKFSSENLNPDSPFYSLITYGFSGGVAGGLCWLTSHPFDTIKTIIQMNDMKEPTLKIKTVFDKFTKDGYVTGILSLYRGGFPSMYAMIISSALFFVYYEAFKKKLEIIRY